MHARLDIERGVEVQGNAHGTDNSALLDALERQPRRLRGVAIVKNTVGPVDVKRMADAGVRALRFHHMPDAYGYSVLGLKAFAALAPRMADLGLHVQFMMNVNALQDAAPYFTSWRLPIVIDHMGNIDATHGVNQPGYFLRTRMPRTRNATGSDACSCRQMASAGAWALTSP